jgi:hypothetical protein
VAKAEAQDVDGMIPVARAPTTIAPSRVKSQEHLRPTLILEIIVAKAEAQDVDGMIPVARAPTTIAPSRVKSQDNQGQKENGLSNSYERPPNHQSVVL